MKIKNELATKEITKTQELSLPPMLVPRERILRYIGPVTRGLNERVLKSMEHLVDKDAASPLGLLVTSTGGPTGTAMNFYDTIRYILQPELMTIGSGDVDSSAIIIFLSGGHRYITARTSLLLHPAGRYFDSQRYTTSEMSAMLAEDTLKDEQYASVVSQNSRGRLSTGDVLALMQKHTILSPSDAVSYGLADALLP